MNIRLPFVAACVAFISFSSFAADPLTVAQVEKVTGLKGLKVTPSKYDKGGISFVTEKNDLAVAVKNQSASVYDIWKSQGAGSDHKPVAGIGDDAISSKQGRYICFKKASKGICVVGMVAVGGTPELVSDAQLLELARLAAAGI